MIEVRKEGVLHGKTSLDFESEAVLNPAVIRDAGDCIHIVYRAISKGDYFTIGYYNVNQPLIVAERLDEPAFVGTEKR
jgi:hypothetical protein